LYCHTGNDVDFDRVVGAAGALSVHWAMPGSDLRPPKNADLGKARIREGPGESCGRSADRYGKTLPCESLSTPEITAMETERLHSIPAYPWGERLSRSHLSTERGFVFQYPPFPALDEMSDVEQTARDPVGLYFHIPFCGYRCSYCYYAISLKDDTSNMARYIANVGKEVAWRVDDGWLVKRPDTIFVGGGTPTFLDVRSMETFFSVIIDQLDRRQTIEFTFESDPASITREKIDLLRGRGVNRMSIGVQSFSDEINRINERAHTRKQSLDAIDVVRRAGIGNLNLDIICGLTGEDFAAFRETIELIQKIRPEHLTMYLFSFRPQTVAFSKTQTGKLPLPPAEPLRVAMYRYARDQLLTAGYSQTTPNCFVINPEFEQIHQRNAWNSYPLLGFGNSAYSFCDDVVLQNCRPVKTYNSRMEDGRPPVSLRRRLSARDLMIRYVVLRIKQLAVPLLEFRRRFGFDLYELFDGCIDNLASLGLVEATTEALRLTDDGIVYVDDVCRAFYGGDVIARLRAPEAATTAPQPLRLSLV
jgi:oxygen-independent coproporphyrinogen III oxidase